MAALGPSQHGREVGLDRVDSLSDLRRLPIHTSESLRPWVDRIAAGEANVLSTEPVEVLEPTGGSTGGTKLVPTTKRLRAEFAEAVGAWMVDLHRRRRRLLGTTSYWSISRAVREHRVTDGGVPIGFDDDAAYFGPLEQWAIRKLMAVPGDVAHSPSMEAWRRSTSLALLEADDLGLISVWSPTFLTLLLDWMGSEREALALALSSAAAARLRSAWNGTSLDGSVLWPRLQLVSAWADGFAARHAPALQARFPGVAFQPKGLLATEGVVSVPWKGEEGAPLALTAHVIELEDLQDGRIVAPWEARLGADYRPLLTTGGGYVRYGLPDMVRVVGFAERVPRVRLLGRLDGGSDRVGEKLTRRFVEGALGGLGQHFAMLLPTEEPLRYTLVVDGDPPSVEVVDARLREAYHYAYARDLGQLSAPEVRVVPDAWRRWEQAVESLGLGDQKPGVLETRSPVIAALLG